MRSKLLPVGIVSAVMSWGGADAQQGKVPECSSSQDVQVQMRATLPVNDAAEKSLSSASQGSAQCKAMGRSFHNGVMRSADKLANQAMGGHPSGGMLLMSACRSYRIVIENLRAMGCAGAPASPTTASPAPAGLKPTLANVGWSCRVGSGQVNYLFIDDSYVGTYRADDGTVLHLAGVFKFDGRKLLMLRTATAAADRNWTAAKAGENPLRSTRVIYEHTAHLTSGRLALQSVSVASPGGERVADATTRHDCRSDAGAAQALQAVLGTIPGDLLR